MKVRNISTVYIDSGTIPFDPECTLKYLRLSKNSENNEAMLEACRKMYTKYGTIFRPLFRYGVFKITEKDPEGLRIVFHDGSSFSGKGIFRLLRNSERAALYVITLGEEADNGIRRLEGEDFLEGYLLNAAASALIEGVQAKGRELIEAEAVKESLHLTKRFSPGYPGWDLPEQEILLSMLNAEEAGMRLTESFLMLPMKSLSGVYGFCR